MIMKEYIQYAKPVCKKEIKMNNPIIIIPISIIITVIIMLICILTIK